MFTYLWGAELTVEVTRTQSLVQYGVVSAHGGVVFVSNSGSLWHDDPLGLPTLPSLAKNSYNREFYGKRVPHADAYRDQAAMQTSEVG